MLANSNESASNLDMDVEVIKRPKPLTRLSRLLLHSKTAVVGLAIVFLVCMVAILAPYIAPHNPALTDSSNILVPPFWLEGGSGSYILGTDNLGRDILSRIIYGSRVSLIVGILAVAVSGIIGGVLGVVSGFFGRWIDAIVMRITDAFLALPGMLLNLVLIGVFGPSLVTLIFVMGFTNWVAYTRLIRSEVLTLKELDYVRAANAIGTRKMIIIIKHLIPNILPSFIVISTINVASIIIAESSLSFLGLGIQPPTVSWGYMLSEGQSYLSTSWWIATFPGIAITITVIGIIFLGDWLRDVLDPQHQGKVS